MRSFLVILLLSIGIYLFSSAKVVSNHRLIPSGTLLSESPNRLVGVWKLKSWVAETTEKTIEPFGDKPYGKLVYDKNGYMTVTLMKQGRAKFQGNDPLNGQDEEMIAAFRTFFTYGGRYSIDANQRLVSHFVEACSNPNWVGGTQVRSYRFDGKRLILQTPNIESSVTNSREAIHELIWEKE